MLGMACDRCPPPPVGDSCLLSMLPLVGAELCGAPPPPKLASNSATDIILPGKGTGNEIAVQ